MYHVIKVGIIIMREDNLKSDYTKTYVFHFNTYLITNNWKDVSFELRLKTDIIINKIKRAFFCIKKQDNPLCHNWAVL